MSSPSWHSTSNATLRYEDSGVGSNELILIHELGGSIRSFDRIVPALDPNFRTIRMDLRGSGQSEKPRAAFSIDDLADDVLDLAHSVTVQQRYWILGAAAGAAVAVACAFKRPERIAGLILCGPALSVDAQRRDYLEARAERAVKEGMHAIVDQVLERSYPLSLRGDQEAFENYRSLLLSQDPVGYAHANRALANSRIPGVDSLVAHSLVMAGTDDRLRPPSLIAPVANSMPHATYVELPTGHLMAYQTPQLVARHIEGFVRGRSLSSFLE
jgi:3-oxoadipate enol-lactonase